MQNSSLYILTVLGGLAVISIWVFFIRRPRRLSLSRLTALAFVSVIAGMFLARHELIGYGLLVVGLALALVDVVLKWQQKQNQHAPH